MYLKELERLSRRQSAKLTIVIDCGVPSVSWKVPGNRMERVSSFRDQEDTDTCLHALLERLGFDLVRPTSALLQERITPGQRLHAKKLIKEMADLKREILHPTPVEVIEPCLAPPRSALHPAHFERMSLDTECRNGGLAVEAHRAIYRAREEKP